MLEVYLAHRIDVVRRRTVFRRGKAADRLHLLDGLMLALVDIDEVIQLIRASDNRTGAKERLMTVFDLSDIQATYILDLTLGRLTKYDRIEVEKEIAELRKIIEGLDAILGDEQRAAQGRRRRAQRDGADSSAPRAARCCWSRPGQTATAASPLEVADDPCWVLLSATGLLARTTDDSPLGDVDRRVKHDTIVSVVRTTARGRDRRHHDRRARCGASASSSCPGCPRAPTPRTCRAGVPLGEVADLDSPALALMTFDESGPGIALGTRHGHRQAGQARSPEPRLVGADLPGRRRRGGRCGDARHRRGAAGVRHLRRPAAATSRPRWCAPRDAPAAVSPASSSAAGQHAVSFNAVADVDDAYVVTIAGSSDALPGTQTGAVKVSPLSIYPPKGRATGGVRCQRLLKGEDGLLLAWVGDGVPMACATSGSPVDLPPVSDRRDGSGVPAAQPVVAVAGPPASQPVVAASAPPAVQD